MRLLAATSRVVSVLGVVGLLATAGVAPAQAAAKARVALELPATATNLGVKPANNSPVVLTDPRDSRLMYMANRLDGPDFSCALQVSGDGGRHWVTAAPLRELPPGVEKCYAPEIAIDRRGTLYYVYVGLAGAGNRPVGAYLTTSSDQAFTFGAPRQVLGPDRFGVRMAIDPTLGSQGRLHLVWLEGRGVATGGFASPPNPIMAAYSDDGGTTLSPAVQVSDAARERVVAPALALGPHHRVHVGYYDLGGDARDYEGLEGPTWEDPWSLVVSTSADGGRSFSPGSVVDDQIVPAERVMLIFTMPQASLVADDTGRVYAAWHDARNHDTDVFLAASTDGRRWDKARRANDDPTGNGRSQYLPRLAVAPGGRVDVVFYDRRLDVGNRGTDTYFTYSADHGKTFAANVRLTRKTFDSQVGPQYGVISAAGLHEFGGRLALESNATGATAAWADTRNTGATAAGAPGQDIFATRIELPVGHGGRNWPFVAGGLVVLGLALGGSALVVSRRRQQGRPGTSASGSGLSAMDSRVRRRAVAYAVFAALLPAVACSSGAPRALRLPPVPPELGVDMNEYQFAHPPSVPTGRIVLVAHNVGHIPHSFSVIPLSEDIPPILDQLRGTTRMVVSPLAAIPHYEPGASGSVALDLPPGRYALVCLDVDPDGKSHASKGMASEFRAVARVAPS